MDSYHLMELPTKVLIGDGVVSKLGDFVEEAKGSKKILVATGSNVHAKVKEKVDSAIGPKAVWVDVTAADIKNVERVIRHSTGSSCIIGVGGGKSVDVGK